MTSSSTWCVCLHSEGPAEYNIACIQAATDYGTYLSNEASPLHTTTLVERCTQKLVDDWNYLRNNVC